ncbi:MAG: restriction endonuclease, partial [Phocaeicola sp.]
CYILRRLKSDIANQLPEKLIEYNQEQMPKQQLNRYKIAINSGFDSDSDKISILSKILAIRTISDHPFLLDENLENYTDEELINSSAKLISTFKILESIKNRNEKVIIFSERRDMQRLLKHVIYYRFRISPRIINGDTATIAGKEKLSRQQTIDYFQSQEGFNVIIMSPLSAGMGLNVVGANHVIHYTRHWNPAKENQATDRAYRIGQTKDVTVYYPMAVTDEFETFDVILSRMLTNKNKLATSSLYPSDMIEVDKQELFNSLFDKQRDVDTTPLTLDCIDRLNGYLFEAFTALYYQKKGYKVVLTTRSGDKGVDVLVFGDNENFAIQSKHSRNKIGAEAVNEILGGIRYYEIKYTSSFIPVVFTNSSYTQQAIEKATLNHVTLIDRGQFPNFIKEYGVFKSELYSMEESREL